MKKLRSQYNEIVTLYWLWHSNRHDVATDMIWHLAQLVRKCGCHIMQPICHTVISALWQQTLCSHSICHMIIQSKWQTRTLDVHISSVQCCWMPKMHWLPIVATIKVWKLSQIIQKKLDLTIKKHVCGYYHINSAQIQFATWKSVCVATIIVIQ